MWWYMLCIKMRSLLQHRLHLQESSAALRKKEQDSWRCELGIQRSRTGLEIAFSSI